MCNQFELAASQKGPSGPVKGDFVKLLTHIKMTVNLSETKNPGPEFDGGRRDCKRYQRSQRIGQSNVQQQCACEYECRRSFQVG
jgi:hypothetical protein